MGSLLRTRGSGKARASAFTSKMEMLISVLSASGVRIVPGASPATDCKGTVYMPWIKDDATEEDFLKYAVSAMHEQSHLHGKSRIEDLKGKPKFHGFCINAVEDIRCELLQEQEFPGLVGYRKREYKLDCEKGKLKEELESASKDNLKKLAVALLKYMIMANRTRQMGMDTVTVPASADLLEYYAKYIADIEDVLDSMEDSAHATRVGTYVYNKIRDMFTDEDKKRDPGEGEDGEDGEDTGEESGEGGKGKPKKSEDSDGDGKDSSSEAPSDDGRDDDSRDSDGDHSDMDKDSGDKSEDSLSEDERKAKEEADRKAREEAAKKRVDEMMDELDKEDDLKTIADKYADDVKAIAEKDHGSYQTANGVKDRLEYGYENSSMGYENIRKGRALLGSIGARMTKLFVSQTRRRKIRKQYDGRFDMTSFITDTTDTRSDAFTRTLPGKLEKAAVSFAIDNSGSMSGTRIKKAYEILAALLYYLDKAGVATEAIGFTAETNMSSRVRDAAVIHTIIKDFDEPFKKKAVSRCHPPARLAQNIELEALRYLAPRLYQRSEGKKIMFVLSDGAPEFGDYTMNRRMAKAYTAYINRLRELGMYVIGFGMDCDVSEYFGEHCINTRTDNIGEAIVRKLTEILNRR